MYCFINVDFYDLPEAENHESTSNLNFKKREKGTLIHFVFPQMKARILRNSAKFVVLCSQSVWPFPILFLLMTLLYTAVVLHKEYRQKQTFSTC